MCHPGKENTANPEQDPFYHSKDRGHETSILSSPELQHTLEGIQLVKIKDLTRVDCSRQGPTILVYS
jgi:hypothetical protein